MTGRWRGLFDRYPRPAHPVSPLEPLGNAGGLSGARLYRYQSGLGPMVARLWPVDGPQLDALARIHGWLRAVGDLIFVPVPISTTAGPSIVEWEGRSWEVAPWMPGSADPSRPPSTPRLAAAFRGLASFHSRLSAEQNRGPSPGLALRAGELDRLMGGEFEQIRRRVELGPTEPASAPTLLWVERASILAPEIARWTRLASAIELPMQPCLRDARPDHFLFVGEKLSGLVDFGAMGRDSVAGDLARLLSEWLGLDRSARQLALEAFEAIHPLSKAERRAMDAFQRANAILGGARWARWHFVEGRRFDDPLAVTRGLARGLERLDQATE